MVSEDAATLKQVAVNKEPAGVWFASTLYDAQPDIITMAKGLTGSYQPLAATTGTEEIGEYVEDDPSIRDIASPDTRPRVRQAWQHIETYEEGTPRISTPNSGNRRR